MNINQIGQAYLEEFLPAYDAQPDCKGRANWTWGCCDYHRNLLAMNRELHALAEQLGIHSEGSVFSAQWWADAGRPDIYAKLMERH